MPILSSKVLSFLSLLVIFVSVVTAQRAFVRFNCNNGHGNYTANSTYQTNLNTLLANLSSNKDIGYGFYNFSYGQNPDNVNAIGMCRGDVKVDACRSCLNDSIVVLTKVCPNQKEAIGWYEECMLRYTNRSIFGIMENAPGFCMWNLRNATDVDQFNDDLGKLLENLRSRAASGDSRRKFAAGNTTGPSFQTIYAHVQCTPDLSELECNDCLTGEISEIPKCGAGKIRGRIGHPSCYLRFDTTPYYDAAAADAASALPSQAYPSSSPPPPSINATLSEGNSNSSRTLVIAIPVLIVAFVVLLILICIYLRVKKPRRYFESETRADDEIEPTETFQFDFQTMQAATDNFSDTNKLGQGGFGLVYKGTLPNGVEVAIKRLSSNSGQGHTEFKNEVSLVAKLQHRNLVKLHGFCSEGRERLLVYEFLPNKSLDYFIFDPMKRLLLNWQKRYKIIEGIARGLLYIHEDSRLRIIHRDLKTNNILLDEDMNPKISDFGMARLFMDQTHSNTLRIAGTYGYMPPEYVLYGQFSVKSDVFSFGVLVLEIIGGQKNNSIRDGEFVEHLASFAWKNWRDGTVSNIVDPTLNDGSRSDIMRCIHIGLLCVQENLAERPSMASVVLMLNSNSLSLPIPSRPAYFVDTRRSDNQLVENIADADTRRSSEPRIHPIEASVYEASITELSSR